MWKCLGTYNLFIVYYQLLAAALSYPTYTNVHLLFDSSNIFTLLVVNQVPKVHYNFVLALGIYFSISISLPVLLSS